MTWKQPIPTSIYEEFGSDYAAMNLYIHGLLRARTEDMEQDGFYKGKRYRLKRGQFIYGRNEFSKYINLSPSGTDKALIRIQKVTSKVTIERTADYSIVTILNYDDITNLNKQSDKQVTSKWQASDTNKIDNVINKKNINTKKRETTKKFSDAIEEAIADFSQHRKKIHKPLSDKAEEILRKRVEKNLKKGEAYILAQFEKAIERGWQGVFYEADPSPPPSVTANNQRQLAALNYARNNT